MRRLFYSLILLIWPVLFFAQVNQDTIYLWDNDRGQSRQLYPSVGAINTGAFIAWQDGRSVDYDIWRTSRNWASHQLMPEKMISQDLFGQFWQTRVDAEGNPNTRVVYAWEDSSYRGIPEPTKIMAAIHNGNPFQVYAGTSTAKSPSVSCLNTGDFIVSYTVFSPPQSVIHATRFNSSGVNQGTFVVWGADSLRRWPAVSRAAYCDSGIVLVYEDSSSVNRLSVYLQYRNRSGVIIAERLKVTLPGNPGETFNEYAPAVSVNGAGFGVVVWQDERNGAANPDIYCRTFQLTPGSSAITFGAELPVASVTLSDERPRVTVMPGGEFFTVWQQKQTLPAISYRIQGRLYAQGIFKTTFTINTIDTLEQTMPDVECRNSDTLFVAWQSNARTPYEDIYARSLCKMLSLDYGMYALLPGDSLLTPDTSGGRKTWYFDDENYDNPATPAWNEDPIDEPDSIFIDLDLAMEDQLLELNTNNQYYIINADTIDRQGFPNRAFNDYDAAFIDLGYRTELATAGIINPTEQATLVNFINPTVGNGRPALVEGNDFGNMYNGTTLFSLFHAQYVGDGGPWNIGNIDTLYGQAGTYAYGETLLYDYRSVADNYPDSIRAYNNGRLILMGTGANDQWSTGRATGYDNVWKSRTQANTVYHSFMLAGITSNRHPHTYAEYYRRLLGFLKLHCQPEPITTLTAGTGSTEGTVSLGWCIARDDSALEPANGGYLLKFSRIKMTSEAAFSDSSEEYYQQWSASGAPGTQVNRMLLGLPPMDSLVFALKVKDNEGLWNALGAEPRAVVQGDSVTPHTVMVGDNFVKDFMNRYELFDVRLGDSLFMSWDQNNFFLGFSRCKFKTDGDLFVYVDCRAGGADSTVGWSGVAGKSLFSTSFRPDFVFILDDSANIRLQKYTTTKVGRGAWVDTTFNGRCSVDSIVNKYLYSEISLPFSNIRYDTLIGFKVVVLVQNEATNAIWNSYPPANPVGGTGLFIPYYYFAANGLRSNLVPNRGLSYIGVEEKEEGVDQQVFLIISPNPFHRETNIRFPIFDPQSVIKDPRSAALLIYDASGRLVKNLSFALESSIRNHASAVSWDGTDQEGRRLATGIYFCTLKNGNQTVMVKAVYIR